MVQVIDSMLAAILRLFYLGDDGVTIWCLVWVFRVDNCHCSEVHSFFRFEPQHIQFLWVMNDSLLQQTHQVCDIGAVKVWIFFGDFVAAVCLGVGLQMWYLGSMAQGWSTLLTIISSYRFWQSIIIGVQSFDLLIIWNEDISLVWQSCSILL